MLLGPFPLKKHFSDMLTVATVSPSFNCLVMDLNLNSSFCVKKKRIYTYISIYNYTTGMFTEIQALDRTQSQRCTTSRQNRGLIYKKALRFILELSFKINSDVVLFI